MGFPEREKKVLATAIDSDSPFIWRVDCFYQWLGHSAFHIYTFLTGLYVCQRQY